MTSLERVLRTLEFAGPDRIPLARGHDPDIAFVGYHAADGFIPAKPGINEWGCKVYMHTCGNLSQHLTALADVGIDLIDNKQPSLWMDSPAVDQVRHRVSFSTCIDIQSVIATIDVERIPDEVSRLIRRLSVREGGFIGTYYGQPDLRIAPEKTERMLAAFRSFTWD